jgi:hypothetical protein
LPIRSLAKRGRAHAKEVIHFVPPDSCFSLCGLGRAGIFIERSVDFDSSRQADDVTAPK